MQVIRAPKNGDLLDFRQSMYPSMLESVVDDERELPERARTVYGYVVRGTARLSGDGFAVDLWEGGYFAFGGQLRLKVEGFTAIITRFGYRSQLGVGKIETRGRLSYIDGCSDSMLIYPARYGDPVLNHLHFPPGIRQTQHTHPSIRLGVVAAGEGVAFGPKRLGERDMWEEALTPGCVFALGEQEMHSFRTTESQKAMDVIAFHPDSDFGPTDQNHPMLNRTYLGADVFRHGS